MSPPGGHVLTVDFRKSANPSRQPDHPLKPSLRPRPNRGRFPSARWRRSTLKHRLIRIIISLNLLRHLHLLGSLHLDDMDRSRLHPTRHLCGRPLLLHILLAIIRRPRPTGHPVSVSPRLQRVPVQTAFLLLRPGRPRPCSEIRPMTELAARHRPRLPKPSGGPHFMDIPTRPYDTIILRCDRSPFPFHLRRHTNPCWLGPQEPILLPREVQDRELRA